MAQVVCWVPGFTARPFCTDICGGVWFVSERTDEGARGAENRIQDVALDVNSIWFDPARNGFDCADAVAAAG